LFGETSAEQLFSLRAFSGLRRGAWDVYFSPSGCFSYFAASAKGLQSRNGSSEIEERDLQIIIFVWNLFIEFRQKRKPNPQCFSFCIQYWFSFKQGRNFEDQMTSSSERQHSSKIRKVLAVRLASRESHWK